MKICFSEYTCAVSVLPAYSALCSSTGRRVLICPPDRFSLLNRKRPYHKAFTARRQRRMAESSFRGENVGSGARLVVQRGSSWHLGVSGSRRVELLQLQSKSGLAILT